VPSRVVRLGAWCDLVSDDPTARRREFSVGEFAVLADGRRIELHADRGWADQSFVAGGPAPIDMDVWQCATREDLEQQVLDVVLPDDAEVTNEDHPWEWLSRLLHDHGVEASPEDLRMLPYIVELSAQIQARIPPSG
jgi:hypothetical protein